MSEIAAEIIELHQFFEDWFNGAIGREEIGRFSHSLHATFTIISPRGTVSEHSAIVTAIEQAHGVHAGQPIRIWVSDVVVQTLSAEHHLATYQEHQTLSETTTHRLSTAVFEQTPNGLLWRHVHETWLPD